jgi:hypothetical protein
MRSSFFGSKKTGEVEGVDMRPSIDAPTRRAPKKPVKIVCARPVLGIFS